MFRTIKLKLPYDPSLLETGKQFKEACQMVLNYGFSQKTYNKNKLNRGTYRNVREKIPTLPSALVQTARDTASESLKQTKLEMKIRRKSRTIRYDRRTFRFYPDSRTVSLTTIKGRLVFPVADSPLINKYRGEYTNAQVVFNTRDREIFVMIQVEVNKETEKKRGKQTDIRVLGIDRGINNIAVLSNNMFFNSRHLKDVRGRYQYNRKKLQHAGTRSAHRKLREMGGRERRFVLNTNHAISKQIVNLPFDVFALEKLEAAKMRRKKNGRRFNHKLGSWSPFQLDQFMEYKAKDLGKSVIYVDPKYTSQTCSKCGYRDRNNRHGSDFQCRNCGFRLHADLNASRDIEVLGRSEYFRLLSTSQSLRSGEAAPKGAGEASNKPTSSGVGS